MLFRSQEMILLILFEAYHSNTVQLLGHLGVNTGTFENEGLAVASYSGFRPVMALWCHSRRNGCGNVFYKQHAKMKRLQHHASSTYQALCCWNVSGLGSVFASCATGLLSCVRCKRDQRWMQRQAVWAQAPCASLDYQCAISLTYLASSCGQSK
jgi:hypothetical protein